MILFGLSVVSVYFYFLLKTSIIPFLKVFKYDFLRGYLGVSLLLIFVLLICSMIVSLIKRLFFQEEEYPHQEKSENYVKKLLKRKQTIKNRNEELGDFYFEKNNNEFSDKEETSFLLESDFKINRDKKKKNKTNCSKLLEFLKKIFVDPFVSIKNKSKPIFFKSFYFNEHETILVFRKPEVTGYKVFETFHDIQFPQRLIIG